MTSLPLLCTELPLLSAAGDCRCRYPTAAAAILLLYSRCRYSYLTLLPLLLLTSLPLLRCRYFSSRMLSLDLSD